MALVAIEDRFDGKRPVDPKFVMIVDKSGSMSPIKMPILRAINDLINEQKTLSDKLNDNASLTVITFADEAQTIINSVPLKAARYIDLSEYEPDGWTALYDAIGMGISRYEKEKNVVFIIVTDGEENKSKYWTKQKINETIEEKKKLGWNFIYLANNLEVARAGEDIGIAPAPLLATSSQTNNINAGFDGLAPALCRQVSRALSAYRQTSEIPNLSEEKLVSDDNMMQLPSLVRSTVNHITDIVPPPTAPIRSIADHITDIVPPLLMRTNAIYYPSGISSIMKDIQYREPLDEDLAVLVPSIVQPSSDVSDQERDDQERDDQERDDQERNDQERDDQEQNKLDFPLQHPRM